MPKPKVYIHRSGTWYERFMDRSNEGALESFAEIVSERDAGLPQSPDRLVERMRGCSAILSLNGDGASDITADIIRAVGCVQVICIAHYWGSGHFTNITAETGVPVIEGSNAGSLAVAEWNVAAALMGTRRLHLFDRSLKAGSKWGEPRSNAGLLAGSIAGVLGLGRIGLSTARYFKALGVDVIAYSNSCSREKADMFGIRLGSLEELLTTADIVSLNHRVTHATRNMLSSKEFAMIKDGCVFINAARAELYDEVALIKKLKTGRFTAYIDVFAIEPLPFNHPFRYMENVVITPHISGNNPEMFRRCAKESIETLRNYFDGWGLVDKKHGYLAYEFPP